MTGNHKPGENQDFSISMEVRDYECDMQGIVNNAVYQNYLEWARHQFLLSRGLDFAELTRQGIIVVVIKAELDYLKPLRSRDEFQVTVGTQRLSRLKLQFNQQILRVPGQIPVMTARVTATCVNERGRPYFHKDLERLL